jgi:hypothetical protein
MPTGLETKKVIVGAGDAAMRPRAPVNVVDGDGSAVIVGRAQAGVDDTVADPTGRRGHAWRGVAELISDEDMAWLLVDTVKSCLTGYERTIVFVELGCGESYLVIKRILTALLSTRMALPVAILSKLAGWLNGYTGSPEEPQLRMMLAVIRLQQFDAV